MVNKQQVTMEEIISLCKRRGFVFPGSEIYGGLANSWDYGPLGAELKNNIKQEWWKRFVQDREDMVGLDAALIMNTKTWEASGHLSNFNDPLIECSKCHQRFRADDLCDTWEKEASKFEKLSEDKKREKIQELIPKCPACKELKSFSVPRQFNLMLKTFLGPTEESANTVYFRPETAQGIFVNFKNIVDTTRKKVPFGIGQIGKAFRNEITPGNFIFRTREFEQMEIEYFIEEKNWKKEFENWREQMLEWIKDLGIDKKDIYELDVAKDELAHYSKKTIDFEYNFPFGQKELYGLAYRTDFDLKNHKLNYRDVEGKEYIPHVIEPTFGVDRTFLAAICSAYKKEEVEGGERVVLKFPNWLSPVKIAVFPLLKNKEDLVAKAKDIFNGLKKEYTCEFDDNGNVGKRYRRQDEIGTPYCVTVDFDTLEDNAVTVRDRDTMKQERIKIDELDAFFANKLK